MELKVFEKIPWNPMPQYSTEFHSSSMEHFQSFAIEEFHGVISPRAVSFVLHGLII